METAQFLTPCSSRALNMSPELGDFGIARVLADAKGEAATVVGTPLYMAPEMFKVGKDLGKPLLAAALFGALIHTFSFHSINFSGNRLFRVNITMPAAIFSLQDASSTSCAR